MHNIFDELIKACNAYCENDFDTFNEIYFKLWQCDNYVVPYGEEEAFVAKCRKLISDYENTNIRIYIYSFAITVSKNRGLFNEFINWFIKTDLNYKEKYYVLLQIASWMFLYAEELWGNDEIVSGTKLLMQIVDEVLKEIPQDLLTEIAKEERNNNLVIVLASQFLSDRHGPTKHAVDHCVSIMRACGKQVLLINTAEACCFSKEIPIWGKKIPSYEETYLSWDRVDWKGYEIPFFQCNNDMPNTETIIMLLETIRNLKPCYVVEIGSKSLVAALVEKIVPVLTNGIIHSSIEISATKYQTIARNLAMDEIQSLKELDRDERNIIYSMFSTEIHKKEDVVTREQLGVPSGMFVVAIVGARLYREITSEYLELLVEVLKMNPRVCFLFLGNFSTYESLMYPYEEYRSRLINFGYTTYTLGCLEQCDLYLNPYRKGGGMSAIEALAAGIPAISPAYGDAGVVLGSDFWISELKDIPSEIEKYVLNEEYYKKQSIKAYERGIYLQDSDRLFGETLSEFERRIEPVY